MLNRRKFIQQSALAALGMGTGIMSLSAAKSMGVEVLTILHTNDVHSRIDPFESGKYKGMGGIAYRQQVINQIRKEMPHVLLLDAGDIFQGTPYFNLFGGEVEIKSMSALGYDAATLGNHDFDGGVDGLIKQLPHASFDFINSNYDFKNSPLKDKILPYKIIQKGKLKIGIVAVGIELEGLVPRNLFGDIIYRDPIEPADNLANFLKTKAGCHLVICLSHLGYSYADKKISDVELAKNSTSIDVILGGHTHTFLERPTALENKNNQIVLVNQVGWGGIKLGRIDVVFSEKTTRLEYYSSHVNIFEKTIAK
jgi:5'-nucleotidase